MKILLRGLVASLLLLATTSLADNGSTVKSQMTTKVENAQPVDNISQADTSVSKTYMFSSIQDCKGCSLEHIWTLDGTHIYTYRTNIKYDKTSWWTTRPGSGTGQWTAEVRIDGQAVGSITLDYGIASMPQQQIIYKRTVERAENECHARLREYKGLLADIPDDPYYKFMVRKWSERCN